MEQKELIKTMHRHFNKPLTALLIHYGIMNVAVALIAVVQVVLMALRLAIAQPGVQPDISEFIDQLFSNGWGYVLAYFISTALLLWWKKPRFCFVEIWRSKKPMTLGAFMVFLCFTVACQAVYEMVSGGLSSFFELFDIGIDDSVLTGAMDLSAFSMVLYAGIIGPIGEEILFRGVVQQSLLPYGKKFSILASAILFGLFHGNLQQSVFAFFIGLVLGYVTAEYSMKWAVLLHIFNNLVLCYLLPMALGAIPVMLADILIYLLIWGCAAGAVLILFFRRGQVLPFILGQRIHPLCLKGFFSTPTVIVFLVLMGINIVTVFLSQLVFL